MNVPAILIDIVDALTFGTPSIILRDDLVQKYNVTIAEATAIIRAAEREINAIDKSAASKQDMLNALSMALTEYSPLGTAYSRIQEKLGDVKSSITHDEKARAAANERISDANARMNKAYLKKEKSLGQLLTESDDIRQY